MKQFNILMLTPSKVYIYLYTPYGQYGLFANEINDRIIIIIITTQLRIDGQI